jgi:EAL and modified HD-GYP domain-containing signal transduction protein
LSFKVLRYINSAAVGLRAKVESIQRAVVLMGLKRLRAWASLIAMAGLQGRPAELLNMGLVRANLCERLSRLCASGEADTAYTVGLLSIMDAMLGRPMHELIDELPLPEDTRRAIVAHEGVYGELLAQAIRIEHNDWSKLCHDLAEPLALEAYAESTEAAFNTLRMLDDG